MMETARTRLNLDARGSLTGPMLAVLLPLLLLQTGQAQGSFSSNLVSVDLGNTSGPENFVINSM